jgi:GT2 family glycosyltransferase
MEVDCLSTRGLMMRVADFIELKGFFPHLIPHYLSDYEFTHRAYKKGYKLLVSPDYYLHFNGETTRDKKRDAISFIDLVKSKFSRKSPEYIISWTCFIILSCPMKYKIKHLVKLWLFPVLYFLIPLKKKYFREEKGFFK